MTTPAIVEGGSTKIEWYKLADGELVEFRFYQYEQAAPEPGQPQVWLVAIRRNHLYLGGRTLYNLP